MNKVLCLGELLLRLSPQLGGRWIGDQSLPVYIGGAELNVASALAAWGIPVAYCSSLPDNYLSKEISEELRRRNIDTDSIHFAGDRIGIYYLPQGADLKNAGVIYDRSHSSFAELKPGTLDWDHIFQDISWFHFSAISPALSEQTALVCKEALQAAARKNIFVSVDLNYRAKLWRYGRTPVEIMPELVGYCDLVMGNIWSAHALLGIEVDASIHEKGTRLDYLKHAEKTAREIRHFFPKCRTVANTFRFDLRENEIIYYGSLFFDDKEYASMECHAEFILDRVGSGDCFMAGLIFGMLHRYSPQEIIDFATMAGLGKFYETGDSTLQDIESIKKRYQRYG